MHAIVLAVLAQVASPPPSIGEQLVAMLLSPAGLGLLIGGVATLLGVLVGTDAVRRRRIALAAYHAFHIVEDLSAETDNKVDDKVAEGLKQLDAYLLANGWRAAKPGEQAVAKLLFRSLNGEAEAATAVQAAAASPK